MKLARACLILALAACSDAERDAAAGSRLERSEHIDEGAVCLRTQPTGELSVQTVIDGCGSGCARVTESSCEVVADGGDLVVHSSVQVEDRVGPTVACDDACVRIGAGCAATFIPPGEYVLRHGAGAAPIRLPTQPRLVLNDQGQLPEYGCDLDE